MAAARPLTFSAQNKVDFTFTVGTFLQYGDRLLALGVKEEMSAETC
jgi:hypothetical protein